MSGAQGHNPIAINPDTCITCMICDYVCPGDVIHQKPRSKELPVIAYPDECWYCGLCEQACPADAITVVFPQEMLDPTTPVTSLLGRDPERRT
ncbi:MAG TPA: ferredoxin family protein [Nocardioides sp.]|nr:ferredoxin family protein [Nocardioides sp.]